MKTKVKNVYYCEYCNKHGLRSDAMEKHEKHCTLNPNRECRLCGNENIKDIIKKYSNAYTFEEEPIGNLDNTIVIKWEKKFSLDDINDDVEGCPVCILTVLRCAKLSESPVCFKLGEFNYKEALQEWWDNENAETYNY